MKRLVLVATLALAACQQQLPAASNDATALVAQAVTAEGGADALRALNAVKLSGDGSFWEPGQSLEPGGPPRFLGTAKIETDWNLASGQARTQWDRDQQYPPPAEKVSYTETVLPMLGFVTDSKGAKPMSSLRVAAQLREL